MYETKKNFFQLGGGRMVTVKMLKPYYIKLNSEYIRIILAYQYFSLLIDNKLYHFVPIEGREILINRKTRKVVNTETRSEEYTSELQSRENLVCRLLL